MKKVRKISAVILIALLLICVAVFSASAADKIQCDINKFEVTTYNELMKALETKSEAGETNPKDVYVVLNNDIVERTDGYTDIRITYGGNVTLDLNGHKIQMTAENGDTMFHLDGENPTNFSIINTAKKDDGKITRGSIYFKSDAPGSSIISSDNSNASVNIIGDYTKYDTDDNEHPFNAVWNHSVNMDIDYVNYEESEKNNFSHYTLYLPKINKVYISGAALQNNTSKAYNLYVGKDDAYNSVLITGKSELTNRGYDLSGANVYFSSRTLSGSRFEWLGSCYIQGGENNSTSYQSISAIINDLDSFNYKAILLDNSNTPFGSTQMPDNTEVYNPKKVTDSKAAVDTFKDIFIRRDCCEGEYPETTFTDITPTGHLTKCNACYSTRSYRLHNFVLASDRVSSTCKKRGLEARYDCTIGGCNYCKGGRLLSSLDPNNHENIVTTVAAVAPTCTTSGKTSELRCGDCGALLSESKRIPAKGHTEVIDSAVAATCTAAGKTEGKHCSVCNAVTVAQTTVPAKGHTEVIDSAVAATCTAAGKTEGKHCSVCNTVIVAQTTIPAHHTEVVDSAVAATCTTAGKTQGKHCSVCNTVIVAQKTVPAKGHTEVIDSAVAATCTTAGKTEGKHCSVCNAVIVAQTTIPAHHTEVVDSAVAATCTTAGKTQGKHCSVCGTVTVAQTTVPAHHTEVVDSAVAATCTTDGKTEGKHCSVCGTVTVAQTTVPAHHTEVIDSAVAATCTADGKTEGKHCSVCGTVTVAQTTVPAKGHKNVAIKAVAATCTKNGSTAGTKCSVCGTVTKATTVVKAKGHSYKTTTTKATTSKNGSTVTKCTVCGSVKSTVTIAKIKSVKLSKTSLTYNGKTQKPTVTVKDNKGKTLKNGTDYTVKYSKGCKKTGQYTVTVTFKGNYSGTKTLTFKIVPKGTSVSKLSAGKKQFKVEWKKQTSQTTGYEIQYSTSSKMKNAKTVTVGKNKTTSTTVKNLKSGKKYYVRIRTYKTVKINGKSVKLYSNWSSVKNIKVK